MSASRSPILLIDRGDLPSLTAAVLQSDSGRLLLWHVVEGDEAASRRRMVVEDHRELFGARDLLTVDAWNPGETGRPNDDPALFAAMYLVQAAIAARRHGCARIIWPVHVGLDAERVRETIDIVTGVAEMTELIPPPAGPAAPLGRTPADAGVMIEVPLLDLDDEQVVDLADDGGAPFEAFWPCDRASAAPCAACAGCTRWLEAYRRLGRLDPWEQASEAAGRPAQLPG